MLLDWNVKVYFWFHSVFSSVAQSCPTLCDPMDGSMQGFPVHHQVPELAQTHVRRVGDAIQPSHPVSPPSPPAFSLSQHPGLFQWVNSLQNFLSGLWSVQSVQSLSHVWLFVTPWTAARQASLSITNSWSLLKLMSIESVMPSSHLILFSIPPPSPPTFSLSQHQGLSQWVSSLHQVAKVLEFQLQHQSFQRIFRADFL